MRNIYCIIIAFSICLMGLGCASPPINERAAAKLALEAARDGQAPTYAQEEYQKAEKTMGMVEKAFIEKDYKNALLLSNIASLHAKYALAVANWKIKANQLKQAQGTLQEAMEEAEQARLTLEDAKKELH